MWNFFSSLTFLLRQPGNLIFNITDYIHCDCIFAFVVMFFHSLFITSSSTHILKKINSCDKSTSFTICFYCLVLSEVVFLLLYEPKLKLLLEPTCTSKIQADLQILLEYFIFLGIFLQFILRWFSSYSYFLQSNHSEVVKTIEK